ncbi:pseudaminic acid synthase [Vibrio alginolyticus]|uniref:pseudaminic acid synthase n=1 Tax=Vibrio TaxID=662 RepID=UPI00216058D7|nr:MULTISPECIES: pseudaminic acid synthase [Vibrio]EGQ8153373.1 pseudaminic acid synthase [Vibrio alginolyticus]ELB2797959.1 pseudaminic acid synthase [Vibrio alginolyticus]MCS0186563.1 pseudaminic acid synthase [Vibrio alginolyticus]MDW1538488.1 pseudaminic acid synthase [Vibrio sp. YT-17]MDW1954413.1 pseudaminic acid synthase [Vibrio sp. Vb0562]
MKIANRDIGKGHKPYIIAEMSGNHNGDITRAIELIKAAKDAGADAVKLQTYTADTITINHDSEEFMIRGGLWDGSKLYDLYEQAHTPWDWHKTLFDEAEKLGITIFSSPFDHTAVDFLESLNAPAYKIASFELIDLPLIRKVAATGKPMIMSTGNANLAEIEEAVAAAKAAGATDIVLLHCTSGYPTPASQANISTMAVMRDAFAVEVGLSDHTMDIGVSVAAVALGACVIEKHFTLARADGGPDSAFSLEKEELKSLVTNCNMAFEAIGKPNFISTEVELQTKVHRRSLYVVKDIKKGEVFTEEHVRSIRPGNGILPKYLDDVLGSKATGDFSFGTPMNFKMYE